MNLLLFENTTQEHNTEHKAGSKLSEQHSNNLREVKCSMARVGQLLKLLKKKIIVWREQKQII